MCEKVSGWDLSAVFSLFVHKCIAVFKNGNLHLFFKIITFSIDSRKAQNVLIAFSVFTPYILESPKISSLLLGCSEAATVSACTKTNILHVVRIIYRFQEFL